MQRFEVSWEFALVFASLVACGGGRDPAGGDEVDEGIQGVEAGADEGIDTGDSDAANGDDDMSGIKFDEPDGDGEDSEMATGGDHIEDGCKKVDLLFVIDNSGSMKDEQINLVTSFPSFIDEIQVQLADTAGYHIGVISTDDYEENLGCPEQEGAMIIATGGEGSSNKVCGPFAEGHSYMTEKDDLDVAFSCAAQIGTDGSGDERGMQTMRAALSPPMNGPGGCNEGFLRDDALLVVVFITDEEDDHELEGCNQNAEPGSAGEPAEWYAHLVAAKKGAAQNIVVLSLIGPPGPDPAVCPTLDKCEGGVIGAEVATRIHEFTNMFTHGFIGRVCEPSYASFFEEAVAVIKSACEDFDPIE
jgi:hypothetical protein